MKLEVCSVSLKKLRFLVLVVVEVILLVVLGIVVISELDSVVLLVLLGVSVVLGWRLLMVL